jgi:hypothetical protein
MPLARRGDIATGFVLGSAMREVDDDSATLPVRNA